MERRQCEHEDLDLHLLRHRVPRACALLHLRAGDGDLYLRVSLEGGGRR
jgi:hypothetical protein